MSASDLRAQNGSVFVEGNCSTLRTIREVEYRVVHPERHVFDPTENTVKDLVRNRPALVVSDTRVAALYGAAWRSYSKRQIQLVGEVLLARGETAKSWIQVEQICSAATRYGLPRDGMIIGIGGGIALDTAGFAASIFRRGIAYLRIPTTLVGLVDVAVGIKHGVNAHGKKNLIGAFYPPVASVND